VTAPVLRYRGCLASWLTVAGKRRLGLSAMCRSVVVANT